MKNIAPAALVTAVSLALIGCNLTPTGPANPPVAPEGRTFNALKPSDEETAIRRVKELTDKLLALSDKCMTLQNENEALREKNRVLTGAAGKAETELDRVQKQLAAADKMLEDLTKDLKEWKKDVLGFREEMRETQALMIKRLCQLILLSGGEVPDDTSGKSVVKTGTTKKDTTNGGSNG